MAMLAPANAAPRNSFVTLRAYQEPITSRELKTSSMFGTSRIG